MSRLACGTPRSIGPPLRSTRLPTASTRAPSPRTTSITSRVEPPVVTTSSTTTTGSPAARAKPRRRAIPPSFLSVNRPRQPKARATSWATSTPPRAGATTAPGSVPPRSGRRRAARSAPRRVASAGSMSTRAHWRERREWSPEESREWPSSRAPRSWKTRSRSSLIRLASSAGRMPAASYTAAPARVSPRILHAVTPISAVLIAQNEEQKIEAAIESVRFCDEVVLVDSGSTDRTRAIAEKAGARVIVNAPWPGFVAQRDFAVRAARHDWVLALDADERVSPALRAEVEDLRTRAFDRPGYRIPRVAQH